MITFRLNIKKKNQIIRNESKYDFIVNIGGFFFRTTICPDFVDFFDELLDSCKKLPHVCKLEKRTVKKLKYFALYFKLNDFLIYLKLDKSDIDFAYFLIDLTEKKQIKK